MYVVTGGAGFVGSQLVRDLLEVGERVVVVDNFSTGRRANLAGLDSGQLQVIEADICDGLWAPMTRVEPSWGPLKAIVHLAAQVSVAASVDNPLLDARLNYVSTTHVLEYARLNGRPKVVFASSAATYGGCASMPLVEEDARWPVSPYGINKFSSELSLRYYAQVHGLHAVSLRFFNVYGPRQDPSSPYSGVISRFMERAHKGQPLVIFGDGEQTRDFVFVQDVSRAIIAAMTRELAGEVINVGTGVAVTVNSLARAVSLVAGQAAELVYAPARTAEIEHSVADITRARSRIGFRAAVNLADGLELTRTWMKATNHA